MLELSVEANHRNTGGRFFPITGQFGISPVTIAGTITTKVPPLSTPLPVRAVYANIRCVETRSGGMGIGGSAENVLWEKSKTLWKSEEDEYVDFGAWTHPFRVTIPPDAAKLAPSSQCLKEWRTAWRFEIIIEHKPIPYVGNKIAKSFYLNLLNYTLPTLPPPSPPSDIAIGSDSFLTRVHVSIPHGAYGPSDPITLSFNAKPDDPTTVIKKASVILDRIVESADEAKPSTSFFRRSTSPRPDDANDAHIIVTASSETLIPTDGGFTGCSMTLDMPKRSSRWDIGETVRTKLVSVRYQIRLKLTVKSAKSRSAKELLCPSIPIQISTVSTSERSNARANAPVHGREKRRHRSSRRGLYMHEGTVEISDPTVVTSRRRTKSSSPLSIPNVSPAPELKPILLSGTQPVQGQSISFVFPSPPPRGSTSPSSDTEDEIPVTKLVDPFPLPPLPPTSVYLSPPGSSNGPHTLLSTSGEFESFSIIKQFQQSGRRISTTASEEEAMLPSRTKQRLLDEENFNTRPSLPSLDALGLGLPHVTGSSPRRPMTAPARTIAPFPSSSADRPRTSIHSLFGGPPPPLFNRTAEEEPTPAPTTSRDNVVSPQRFAFSVKPDDS